MCVPFAEAGNATVMEKAATVDCGSPWASTVTG
jgi:hypothetical protein